MTPVAVRMSGVERRADVLRAAVPVFAKGGYHGTSTEDVAKAAGISQPYLFRLFPTKKALFLALIEQGFGRVRDAFIEAVGEKTGEAAMEAMGEAYGELLRDRDELMLQMHFYSSSGADEEIAAATRLEFGRLWRTIATLGGASDEELQKFFATGMLMNVIASMDATSHDSSWIKACLPPGWLWSESESGLDETPEPAHQP